MTWYLNTTLVKVQPIAALKEYANGKDLNTTLVKVQLRKAVLS